MTSLFQVFCYVAQRMTAEGSEKTWDQCRIKLKNLKSQYRYVKDRIPNIGKSKFQFKISPLDGIC